MKLGESDGIIFLLVCINLIKPLKLVCVVNNKRQGEKNSIMQCINDFFIVSMLHVEFPTILIPMDKESPIGLQIVGQYGDSFNPLNFSNDVIINSKVLTI